MGSKRGWSASSSINTLVCDSTRINFGRRSPTRGHGSETHTGAIPSGIHTGTARGAMARLTTEAQGLGVGDCRDVELGRCAMSRWLFPVLCLGLLVACATGPRYDLANVNTELTPAEAVQAIERYRGESVVWGGRIIQTHNLPEQTRLEVLAYPLDSNQRPRLQSAARGRFLIDYPGYLERADFAADREKIGRASCRERGEAGGVAGLVEKRE